MLNGKKSNYNEVVKEIRFITKKFGKRSAKQYFVKLELSNGTIAELQANRAEVDLVKTLKECGVEKPIRSFEIETLMSDNGNEYNAIVLRLADKNETTTQYMIPYTTQNTIETLLDAKAKEKAKGVIANGK
jgi:type IV pilus biogenesis protein CpaD/CtpE